MRFSLAPTILALMAAYAIPAVAAQSKITPPAKPATVKVAFALSEGVQMIDFAGPWEVFQDAMLPGYGNDMQASMPFELYTVAPTKAPLHTTGGRRGDRSGMTVIPDYSFADAPTPDIVVVPAQNGGPGLTAWLQKLHTQNKTVVSVCTGAYFVAAAGLFDGKSATTHHWSYDDFARQYPKVKLQRSVRYVQADPITFSAGGITSGVDLALHIVAQLYGDETADYTADFMEYQGTGWKTNQGIGAANATPKKSGH